MTRTIPIILTFLSLQLSAQSKRPATTIVGIQELRDLSLRIQDGKELVDATQAYYPTALIGGRCMVGFLGQVNTTFDPVHDANSPIRWGARKGNVISFRVDAHQLDALDGIVGLELVELAGKVKPDLDRLVKAIRADSVHMGIGLPQPFTGKDVLIGITDWGFDYTHPMLYDTTLTETRIRAAWDQYRNSGPAPAAYGYGTELTMPSALLATGADTANIYSFATHGTHVAGIAGGSGAGTPFRGVAFESQFLLCTFLVDAAAVLDAFSWMQDIAEQDGKRLVINMSWGLHHIGTLDGTSLLSQAIDQFSEEGVVFVNSGGNNGSVDFHIRKEFTGDTLRSQIQFYPYSANPNMWGQSISMWGEPGESFSAGFRITNNSTSLLIESPWYATADQEAYLDSFIVAGVDTVYFNLTADAAHPQNARPHFRLRVKSVNTQNKISLKATAPGGTVHFWNVTELSNDVGNWGQAFQAAQSGWVNGDRNYGISEPACTESLIAVAAYSAEYVSSGGTPLGGAIASFSSYGPTLDERIKPDITAPGVSVASSISSFTDNDYTPITSVEFEGTSYPFARFSGTSMAAPAVTGVVALMLEADPTLSPAEVKEIIRHTARTDNHTGVIPVGGSTRWGAGKVNAYLAVRDILGLSSVPGQALQPMSVWPVPVTDELFITFFDPGAGLLLRIRDVTGRTVHSMDGIMSDRLVLDARHWPSGMYFVEVSGSGMRSATKFIKH